MVKEIGIEEAHAAYLQAVRVWNRETSESDALAELTGSVGMNRASASDLVRNLSQMLKGIVYHRTLNELVTRFYFDQIYVDFGIDSLRNAIGATNAHLDYYEKLPSGGRRPGMRKLCDEYETQLAPNNGAVSAKLASRFQQNIALALQDTPEARQLRLENSNPTPKRYIVSTFAYSRNHDVVAERLFQAKGICDNCRNPAPFERKNGEPFLEVHHKLPLAEGGKDRLNNTMALCPNCHREAHLGKNWMDYRE